MTADRDQAQAQAQGGNYHFRSWVRRGVGADAGQADGPGLPARAELDVTLTVTALTGAGVVTDTPPPQMKVYLYGPGDVIGVDPRHVIRTEPRDLTMNFEPNYLAGIEFDQPDFPWLFTPALPDADRLRPFVALIALKDDEYTTPKIVPNPLPAIDVTSVAALQDLGDSWNWAHAQISGDADLAATISANPAAAISRLLCPRRLDPETSYNAFLVPAFEIGRLAGLGLDVSTVATADPAWTSATAAPLRLPFYYRFSFRTSDAGDFESLVRKLTPTELPGDVGSAPMAVDNPAAGVPGAGAPLGLEGALRSAATTSTPWSGPARDAFQLAVQDLLNLTTFSPADDPDQPAHDDPHIVPPFYGQWHAAIKTVAAASPGWPSDLNLDPRNRSAAGMGTRIVQGQRVALLASAWEQVAGVEAANQLLRNAQLSRGALTALWNQHLQPAAPATLLALTAPVHTRIMASPQTVRAVLAASRVPERILSGSYRKLARPLGPLSRRATALAGLTGPPAARTPLLARISADDVRIAPPSPPPGAMTSIDQVSDSVATAAEPTGLPAWLRRLLDWLAARFTSRAPAVLIGLATLVAVAAILAVIAAALPAVVIAIVAALAVVLVIAAVMAAPLLSRLGQADAVSEAIRFTALTGPAIASAPPAAAFAVTEPPTGVGGHGTVRTAAAPGGAARGGTAAAAAGDSPAAARFRDAVAAVLTAVHAPAADPPLAPALDLASLTSTVVARLNPAVTVPALMSSMVRLPGGVPWFAADPIEPIMAAPSFPQPMYMPLRDLNQDYLLPGVELIPPDTLGAVVANHAFIEGFMVGLNHEMARQLLWNGYPTDQRGSYFRQFWDVAGYLPQAGDPGDPGQLAEALKDIPPIHTWPATRALGDNENRPNVVADNVVLLVRGELLRRYPNTVIFAGRARAAQQGEPNDYGRALDETDERFPIFRGTLGPDITFFGFNLSVDDARGGTAAAPLGFFFVFQEQPTEPRFGLEPDAAGTVQRWEDLAWTNFTGLSADRAAPGGADGDSGGAVGPGAGGAILAGAGPGTLPASAISSVFPELHPTEISRYRVASSVFAGVLAAASIPDFLTAGNSPSGVALDGSNPQDSALSWGQDSAQTAAITIRMPFRILVHVDSLLPRRP
jgi:hypothetical protein